MREEIKQEMQKKGIPMEGGESGNVDNLQNSFDAKAKQDITLQPHIINKAEIILEPRIL